MSSRFIQGDGYPIVYRYDSSDVLQETINLPYVRDDGKSFIRQYFDPYPSDKYRQHELLDGTIGEDSPEGYKYKCIIQYNSIDTTILKDLFNCIVAAKSSGYLKLKPRDDSTNIYKVIYVGDIRLESRNAWQHNITLEFHSTDLVSSPTFGIPTAQ